MPVQGNREGTGAAAEVDDARRLARADERQQVPEGRFALARETLVLPRVPRVRARADQDPPRVPVSGALATGMRRSASMARSISALRPSVVR